jgi:hypothetical protein
MKTPPATRYGARATLVALAASFALLALGAQAATAAPAATQRATSKCWLAVINDWLDNNRVDHTYPIACYTQAIQHLNAYPDVQQYSSAADDIHRALLALLHGGGGRNGGISGGGTSGGGTSGGGTNGGGTSALGSGGSQSTPIKTVLGHASDAQSVPLPLIVLAALAMLLLLAGGGTWVLRRFQMRRMTPATEPAAGPPPRP